MAKIGEYRLKIYELLYCKPICEYAENIGSRKEQNILIIGNGWAGNEAFKASFWAGQYINSELNITVASQNALEYKNQVLSTEPGAVLPSLHMYTEKKHYANLCFTNINIESGVDEAGLAPLDFMNKKYNYVIISLGDAEHNWISASELVSLISEAKKNGNISYNGKIIINVFNEFSDSIDKDDQKSLISFGAANDIEVNFFGEATAFTGSDLERVARNINFSYEMKYDQRIGKNQADERFEASRFSEFVQSPFDYQIGDLNIVSNFIGSKYAADSSYAAAVHIPVKLAICREFNQGEDVLDTLKEAIKKKNSLYKKLIALEHRRWNAYMIMRGYRAPSEQEESKLLYHGSNTHQDKDKLLHICLCDCGEKGVMLENDFDRQYKVWIEKKCPKNYPSELDRASLRCHQLTTGMSQKFDVKKVLNSIQGNNLEYVNLRRSINKLVNDEENSLMLYSKALEVALTFAHSVSTSEYEKIKAIDSMLTSIKARNARMDFLSLDAQLIEMIPFSLWYGKKFTTIITISDGTATQDVIIPTLFCAPNALFIGKKVGRERYQQSVISYFENRGSTTKPQFISLTELNTDSIYNSIQAQIQKYSTNELIINCVLHKNFDALIAVGMLIEKYSGEINAVQYLPNKGIVSFSKDKNIGVGLDNKSYSLGEFISLMGGRITNEYNTLYDSGQYEALLELFRDFSKTKTIKKEDGSVITINVWSAMTTFFSSSAKDDSYDTLLNQGPSEQTLYYQGKLSSDAFTSCMIGETLKSLQEHRIIRNYREKTEASYVQISFEYCDTGLESLLQLFEINQEAHIDLHKVMKFIPLTLNGGLKISNLQVQDRQLFDSDEPEEQINLKKKFLQEMLSRGFINDLVINQNGTTTFVFKDEPTMSLFKKQGSVFELIVYHLLRESCLFDDVETGVKIAWNSEEKPLEQILIEQLNESEAFGYRAYAKMRQNVLQTISQKSTENELDVIAINGMSPIFVSCKTGKDNKMEWLYEIASISEHFMSTGVMAISNDLGRKTRSMFQERAKQMNVPLLGTDTLWEAEKLRETLRGVTK